MEKGGVQKANQPVTRAGRSSFVRPALTIFMLLTIAGFNAASIAAAVSSGWAYFHENDFVVPAPYNLVLVRPPFNFQIWIGWYRGTDTLREDPQAAALLQLPHWLYLRDVHNFGQIWGYITVSILGIACLLALSFVLGLLCNICSPGRYGDGLLTRMMRPVAVILGLLTWGVTITLYILIAVGNKQHIDDFFASLNLPGTYNWIAWPSWAWWLSMVSGLLWLIIACLAGRKGRYQTSHTVPPTTHNMAYNPNQPVSDAHLHVGPPQAAGDKYAQV